MVEQLLGVLGPLGVLAIAAAAVWKLRRENVVERDDVDDVVDMRSVRRVRLASIAGEDLVRVAGVVSSTAAPLTAPLSGRACVAWVIELRGPGLDVRVFFSDRAVGAFTIEEEGMRARIEPPCEVLALSVRLRTRVRPELLPSAFRQWLEEAHSGDEWEHMSRLEVRERRIEPGEPIAVVGLARRGRDGDGLAAGYRDAPEVVLFENAEGAPLSLSDHPSLLLPAEPASSSG
jgi:hypothetical protein